MKNLLFIAFAFSLALPATLQAESISGKRPNILFILTDDQGYGDISAHGNPGELRSVVRASKWPAAICHERRGSVKERLSRTAENSYNLVWAWALQQGT